MIEVEGMMGVRLGTGVGREVAVGGLTRVGTTVTGGRGVGVVVWLGVQPKNRLLKMVTTQRMAMKRYFIFALLEADNAIHVTRCHANSICPAA
jgi:hypothetical protein